MGRSPKDDDEAGHRRRCLQAAGTVKFRCGDEESCVCANGSSGDVRRGEGGRRHP